jgi:mevalonate kinase
MENSRSFQSKILLFGEYSIIQHSMALAIPYSLFEGKLVFKKKDQGGIDHELQSMSKYIESEASKNAVLKDFDNDSFEFDVSQGLVFNSSIPRGYGVGSSGALCAALFERYMSKKPEKLQELRGVLASLEGQFHGSSSGVDPLISYLGEAILMNHGEEFLTVKIPEYDQGDGGIFLLNTGRARRTEPLVNLYLEKCKNEDFRRQCADELIPYTNQCIQSFLEGELDSLYDNFKKLSRFQYDHFSPMIPKLFKDVWIDGIESGDYILKLCGAGGGGFLLGITKDFKQAKKSLKDYELRPLYRFN